MPLVFWPTTSSFRLSIVGEIERQLPDPDAVRRRGVRRELVVL